MASHDVQAERLRHSEEDPNYHPDCSEELEVDRSYNENASGNAQAAVEDFMHNMNFLQREGELVYVIPKGAAICMQLTPDPTNNPISQTLQTLQAFCRQKHVQAVKAVCNGPLTEAFLCGLAGHVKGMNVPARFYASPELLKLVSNEFRTASGGFTGAVQQLANVATLPGLQHRLC